ncbi:MULTISPECIES: hypothetical protein [unclassified Bradyrhizobium]|uniref:hypothetical protein n=1 Tax=unclassified Bradyrhizobium TaxID=2631580 RepID=UPI0029160AB2|nr:MULTISPECIES: hypothetical protein [unclassified Bradyrhizobium]
MMLAIKLAVTPLMMLAISLAARQWGTFVSGLLSGLPLTSGPISVYLAVEQGELFAQRAAVASLAGLAAVLIAYLAYALLTRVCTLALACALSVIVFCASAWALLALQSPVLAVAVVLAMIAILLGLTKDNIGAPRGAHGGPAISLPVRLVTAATMVLLTTSFARLLGPDISGVVSLVPVIAWPLTLFAHLEGGRTNALRVVRGNAIGAIGVVSFYLVVAQLILSYGSLVAFSAATAAAVLAAFVLVLLLRPRKVRALS